MKNKIAKKVCFEEAIGKLELIVKQLEDGDLTLDESLACFAEGFELSKFCLSKLTAAEQQIDLILADDRGRITAKPLEFKEEVEC